MEYTLAHAVADLDALRQAIHAAQVDLIGYSWGATLAAAYLATHGNHVAKVIFVSPGPMVGVTSNLADLLSRLDAAHLWAVSRQALEPRAFMAWILVQANPRAAHAFAGDAEMDARFRAIIAALAPALYCHPPPGTSGGEPGFYANAMLLRPEAWRGTDPHAALRRLDTPALIVKGQCDYLSWASAVEYRDTLRNASMVYLPGAGHRLYAERPDAFFAAVAPFLDGRELPFPTVTQSIPPPGYEGPAGTAR
jgi:proline iminopeptidase